MKKRLISSLTAASMAVGMLSLSSYSAGEPLDYSPNGHIDVFDMIAARRSGASGAELKTLHEFLMGRGNGLPVSTDYTLDESLILEPMGTVHTGEGTFYGGGYEGGCASLDPVSRDYWIVAMNLADYNEGQLAGAYIEVTGELGTIKMLVTDLLPEGKKGDLDLYTDAFPLIAPVEKGRVPVSWHIIPLDTAENAPVCYKYKEGTTQYWCGIQVRNHRYPITRLEYLDKNGEWVEIPRTRYNYFISDKMGAGPFTFRITDIYGRQVIDRDIPLSTDDTEIIQGHVQLPE